MNEIGIGNLPPTTADFLPQYKAIGQSLKKRFFRKPNVAEAIVQYEALGQELQREEQKSFAAVCYLESAKCQESLRNNVQQANSLVKAAKLFLEAWESEQHFNFNGEPFSDQSDTTCLFGNLELGIQTLSQAAKSFSNQGNKGSAILINMQLGDILYRDGSYGEALNYYKIALIDAKQSFSLFDQLLVTELVCKAKVKMMELESVLKTVNDSLIAIKNYDHENEVPAQFVSEYAQKFQIMKVMLVLILGGNTTDVLDFIWPKLPVTSADAGDDDFSSASPELYCESTNKDHLERREVTYLLKSLVLAVQENSSVELRQIHNKLIPVMDESHHDLMKFLLQMQR
ncbi:uncharacterized protein LOC110851232 [Folsomia candida]|uniref:Factor VIII intron 22 protein n=1 Tax=Folsomia candida TaxID=158441 RepID=A0A226E5X6_FOLCA|nr:uncharacterized protein LOC110851232 [Folsomia candida]XP_035709067.1 uncharacterized protein LOC110851232 [Folsomia candida]OXA52698.1 Factor VIII intron 22 protein [Folsomia candida]